LRRAVAAGTGGIGFLAPLRQDEEGGRGICGRPGDSPIRPGWSVGPRLPRFLPPTELLKAPATGAETSNKREEPRLVRLGLGFLLSPGPQAHLRGVERSSSRSSPSISQRPLRCLPFPGHISRVAAKRQSLVCAECGRESTLLETAEDSWRAYSDGLGELKRLIALPRCSGLRWPSTRGHGVQGRRRLRILPPGARLKARPRAVRGVSSAGRSQPRGSRITCAPSTTLATGR